MAIIEYSITDLERETKLNRRTIHFYIKQGVIPPPTGQGGGAKYNEEHMLRLFLIPELQKTHLKLSGIAQALNSMTINDMRSLVGNITSSTVVGNIESLQRWVLGDAFESEGKIGEDENDSDNPDIIENFSFLDIAKGRKSIKSDKKTSEKISNMKALQHGLTRSIFTRSTAWEKVVIVDGVEVLIRSDLMARYQEILAEFAAHIRQKK